MNGLKNGSSLENTLQPRIQMAALSVEDQQAVDKGESIENRLLCVLGVILLLEIVFCIAMGMSYGWWILFLLPVPTILIFLLIILKTPAIGRKYRITRKQEASEEAFHTRYVRGLCFRLRCAPFVDSQDNLYLVLSGTDAGKGTVVMFENVKSFDRPLDQGDIVAVKFPEGYYKCERGVLQFYPGNSYLYYTNSEQVSNLTRMHRL